MKNIIINIKRILAIIILSFTIISALNVSYAEEIELIYNDAYLRWLELPEEEKKDTLQPPLTVKNISSEDENAKVNLTVTRLKSPAQYDLREKITIKQKDQKKTGTCWAFASLTALETNIALTRNMNVEYSPRHMEYATSRTFLDGINNTVFNREIEDGGPLEIPAAYFTSGIGPIYESEMPFQNSTKRISLSEIKGKEPKVMVKEYISFPNIYKTKKNGTIIYSNGANGSGYKEYDLAQVTQIRNKMKEHITKYGGIAAGMAFYKELFSSDSKSLNCNDIRYISNHAITIIGWDDNYAVTNFKEKYRPSQPGAWLIRNSHGTSASNFYISYEDLWIESSTLGIIETDDINYDKIYQYDYYGANADLTISKSEAYVINVFKKEEKAEFINEISFYTEPDEEFELLVNPYDGSTDENKFIKIKSIDKTDSNYITVELDEPIAVTNKEFAVMVKYKSTNGILKVPVEAHSDVVEDYFYCTSNAGESFYNSGQMMDMKEITLGDLGDANACVKAFTKLSVSNPKSVLTSSEYTVTDSKDRIKGIGPDTTTTEFKNNILLNADYEIIDKNEDKVTNDTSLATGMKLETEFDEKYTIIIKGDVNGDGKVTGTDLLQTKNHVIEYADLTGDYLIAGDVNEDGETTGTDVLNIKKYICDIISF